jgi:hypothetical protein
MNATLRIGAGCRGPYITSSGTSSVTWTDGWGNPLNYAATSTTVVVKSLGADNAAGGTGYSQDLNISLTISDYMATVRGFISANGSAINAEAQLYKPDGAGGISVVNLTSLTNGYFSTGSVPFGKRSIKLFVPNIASPTSTIGPVPFTVDQSNYEVPANIVETQY